MNYFKPDPKKQVSIKFVELFGKEPNHVVCGRRMTHSQCEDSGLPQGSYVAEIVVDDTVVATATSVDWRRAYKLLALEVEKLHTEGLSLI